MHPESQAGQISHTNIKEHRILIYWEHSSVSYWREQGDLFVSLISILLVSVVCYVVESFLPPNPFDVAGKNRPEG